jgi:hypothetical protein
MKVAELSELVLILAYYCAIENIKCRNIDYRPNYIYILFSIGQQ